MPSGHRDSGVRRTGVLSLDWDRRLGQGCEMQGARFLGLDPLTGLEEFEVQCNHLGMHFALAEHRDEAIMMILGDSDEMFRRAISK
jgi:hypothetical protein